MAWIGGIEVIRAALRDEKADRLPDGSYLLTGQVISFMGAGDEYIVGDDARYYVGGKEKSLTELLNKTSGGVSGIKVF